MQIYCGYDPRTTDIHIGHTITMRKLRQFQELGHEVTFLIGTYTSLIGDPSDKDKMRPQLTPEEVEFNARSYAEQAFKILDPEKMLVMFNSSWMGEMSAADLIQHAGQGEIVDVMAGRLGVRTILPPPCHARIDQPRVHF